jgi:hypothetical protein
MERRRWLKPLSERANNEEPLSFQRSLRFREGPMGNCSPYLAGAGGRNIEKYSMGRGVFSGPTAGELAQIASRMDFHPDPQVEGLVNLNCADQKVLMALPFLPPESARFSNVTARLSFAALMSQILVMGRSQRGFDGEIAFPDEDDDGDGQADLDDMGWPPNTSAFRWPPFWDASGAGTPRNTRLGFGRFATDDDFDGFTDDVGEAGYPGGDDGPYREVGEIARALFNPVVVEYLRQNHLDNGGWLKPAGSTAAYDESDIAIMLGRIANLGTVQSNEFIVSSHGRIFNVDSAGKFPPEKVADQRIQADLKR